MSRRKCPDCGKSLTSVLQVVEQEWYAERCGKNTWDYTENEPESETEVRLIGLCEVDDGGCGLQWNLRKVKNIEELK